MRSITLAGRTPSIGGNAVAIPEWYDLATWRHAWDVTDSQVINDRVVWINDPIGGRPMRTFPDDFPLLGADPDVHGLLPGPLYLESSPRFNGRPALACDYTGIGPAQGAVFHLHAGLTPNVSVDGTQSIGAEGSDTDIYFDAPNGYAQPYWVAVLARVGTADNPANDPDVVGGGVWDATHGGVGTGPTIGGRLFGLGANNWAMSNFGPSPLQVVVSHAVTKNETVLILGCVNGASSFLEINWRDAGGVLRTLRATGSQNPWRYLECFIGWVHGAYLTAAGIGLGVPNEDELTRIRNWAAPWMPPAGVLTPEM